MLDVCASDVHERHEPSGRRNTGRPSSASHHICGRSQPGKRHRRSRTITARRIDVGTPDRADRDRTHIVHLADPVPAGKRVRRHGDRDVWELAADGGPVRPVEPLTADLAERIGATLSGGAIVDLARGCARVSASTTARSAVRTVSPVSGSV
jgi:hypothetical protein